MTFKARWAVVLAAVVAGGAGVARAQPFGWAQRGMQEAAHDPAMAYDSDRHVCVLFGGYTSRGWTMEWDGASWSVRSTTGPSPRFGHMMAYDSARHVTVMFGGAVDTSGGEVRINETWEWNGAAGTWQFRCACGPSPRSYGVMVYDAARGRCVQFGGNPADEAQPLGGTWEWDGSSWSQRSGAEPSARVAHGMCYDSARGVTVLFGGATGVSGGVYTGSRETWELGAGGWVLRADWGPSVRGAHAMAYDSVRGVSVLFGGYTLGGGSTLLVNDETWEWNGAAWTRREVDGPTGRAQHVMAFDAHRGVTVLQSGYEASEEESHETWELAGTPPCVADFDDGTGTGTRDGAVTIEDLLYYLGLFEAGGVEGDVDDGSGTGTLDGAVTIEDLLFFLAHFEAGC